VTRRTLAVRPIAPMSIMAQKRRREFVQATQARRGLGAPLPDGVVSTPTHQEDEVRLSRLIQEGRLARTSSPAPRSGARKRELLQAPEGMPHGAFINSNLRLVVSLPEVPSL